MNREIPDVQAGFRKGRGTRDQIANIRWIMDGYLPLIARLVTDIIRSWKKKSEKPPTLEEGKK